MSEQGQQSVQLDQGCADQKILDPWTRTAGVYLGCARLSVHVL